MAEWFSIEIFDGLRSARSWVDSFGDTIIESGIAEGAVEWRWHHQGWGSVLEIAFRDEASFERFKGRPVVDAALDSVPDRVNGLLIYKGRGGTSGTRRPRRPRPFVGSGSMAVPIPDEPFFDWLTPEELRPRVLALR